VMFVWTLKGRLSELFHGEMCMTVTSDTHNVDSSHTVEFIDLGLGFYVFFLRRFVCFVLFVCLFCVHCFLCRVLFI